MGLSRPLITTHLERGVTRLLMSYGQATLNELVLPDGRRADVVGVCPKGIITIVEIKSGIADFRTDEKWPDYRSYCDRLFFAVDMNFPLEILPPDTGIIIADRYGGSIERAPPAHPLAGSRRKVILLSFARTAASRLAQNRDPTLAALA